MYHAGTVTAYRKWLWVATLLASSSAALAQNAEESGSSTAASRGEPPAPGEWRAYPRERHILGRVAGGIGFRLADAYGVGPIAPPFAHIHGAFTFLNVGRLHMGPSLGTQLGFDTHARVQGTAQVGWLAYWRMSSRIAILGRFEVPLLFTGTWNPDFDTCITAMGTPAQPPAQRMFAATSPCNVASGTVAARLPDGKSLGLAFGLDAGAMFAFFVTGGFAVTAEVNGGVYFGDSFVSTPLVGVTLGALVDYELIPSN